jgi:hypothetical protein
MHRGLALAHGGRLQAPRLDYAHRSTLEIIFFEGAGFTRELPLQDHLNQEPFIKALVERYERSGPLPDVLWTALGWMQTDTSFDETRFLSGMTALEAIVENQLPGRRGTIIAKKEFKPVREKLEQLISAEETIPPEAKAIFLRNVAGLNRKDFFQKINALFDHYQIPKRDFEGNIVRDLIKLRNDIVHWGGRSKWL